MPTYPDPRTPDHDPAVEALLQGAVDLHCHSGPAVMPRTLDHHDQMLEADAAGFRAVVFKDHYYLGSPACLMLEKLVPEAKVRLFSGIVLNNAHGGINPHAVHHAVTFGAKIIWMPTLSAKNHIDKLSSEASGFPKVEGAPDPIPVTVLDADGRLTDATKEVLDLIAMGDIILAGGHLGVHELFPLFEEAKARGVTKMIVNHPTYLIGCSDEDIRGLVAMGVKMEHSITQFIQGRGQKLEAEDALHLVKVAGPENTLFCSDLGLKGANRPVDGYRILIGDLLKLQVSQADIRTMFGDNAAALLNLQ
ncbi:DUF6282 family protein [Psychromarinibacter sp. C21-152]|uniref:DUF6282 family protein n=2 Tax=Psychromarinibacter sediminicola TaxID=3033385 RepID=A0AAE3TA85_9RHOB|nr:DUF6282 family protein [Psychromarinibacter sediminicola]